MLVAKIPKADSPLEAQLVLHLKVAKLPMPQREYQFCRERKWRFDLAWPDQWLAVEIDGGTWIRGAHSRGYGQRRDCQKQNAAVARGWRLYRFTSDMVQSGEALATLMEALT